MTVSHENGNQASNVKRERRTKPIDPRIGPDLIALSLNIVTMEAWSDRV